MSWDELGAHVRRVASTLHSAGLGPNDPIGIVLPNGPELATTLVATAAAATCAPIDSRYRPSELASAAAALGCKGLVLPADQFPVLREQAKQSRMVVFDLLPVPDGPAGAFNLRSLLGRDAKGDRPVATSADRALLMLTSGTTAQPKVVPLTHGNVCWALMHLDQALELTPEDRSLAVMPLHHTHGLIRGLLMCLAAGGSVVCPPEFNGTQFWDWLDTFRPSYYSSSPAMHSEVAEITAAHPNRSRNHTLRFVGSSSAPMPVTLAERLEALLEVPIIDSYGTTETGPLISCNPLPPQTRKPGSVGRPAGCEVRIVTEDGKNCSAGATGEVAVRGPNVFHGYLNDPAANRDAFLDGWFRTGDLGRLDDAGYLSLVGRTREIINRGGEKISLAEVEETLRTHPAVKDTAVFPVAHPTLGETVGAAVVMQAGLSTSVPEILEFVAARVVSFKVPSHIVTVETIPRTATGKVRRRELSESAVAAAAETGRSPDPADPPFTDTEQTVAEAWREVLGAVPIGRQDNFMALGGDSLKAIHMVARLADRLDVPLQIGDFFEHPTFGAFAALVTARVRARAKPSRPVSPARRSSGPRTTS